MNNILTDPLLWFMIALLVLATEVWRISNQVKRLTEYQTINTISLYLLIKKLDEKDIIKEGELNITTNNNEGV